MNTDDQFQPNKWLVRSGGRILGPYTLSEVRSALEEKRITLLDEIRCPESRWAFLREHADLKSVVDWYRQHQLSDKEATDDIRSKTLTDTEITIIDEELTPAIIEMPPFKGEEFEEDQAAAHILKPTAKQSLDSSESESGQSEDTDPIISYDEQVEKENFLHVRDVVESQVSESVAIPIKRYGAQLPNKSKKRSSSLLWSSVLLAVALLSVSLVWRFSPVAEDRPLNFNENIKLAKFNRSLQYYGRALEYFERASQQQALDPANRLLMLPLYMEVEGKTGFVREQLAELSLRPGMESNLEIDLFIGLSYLKENNYKLAADKFAEIMAKDVKRADASINFLITMYHEKNYEGLLEAVNNWIKQNMQDPIYVFIRAMSAFHLQISGKPVQGIDRYAEDLQTYIGIDGVYRSEAQIVLAGLYSVSEQPLKMVEVVQGLLSESPRLSMDLVHDIHIDQRPFLWRNIFFYCNKLVSSHDKSALMMGLMTYCLYKRGDMLPAVQLILQAREAYPANEVLLSLEAFLYLEQNQIERARAALRLSSKPNLLHYLVRARMCAFENDLSCADINWKEARKIQPKNPDAIYGLAWVARQRGDLNAASDLIKEGLLAASRYRPLIEMREELGNLMGGQL